MGLGFKNRKLVHSKWWLGLLTFVTAVFLAACGNNEESSKKNTETNETETKVSTELETTSVEEENPVDTSAYTAENVHQWFLESDLLSGNVKEDITNKTNSEGVIQAINAGEVTITEYETEEQAAESLDSYGMSTVFKNIIVFFSVDTSQADNFTNVLKAGKPLTNLDTTYKSDQQKIVHQMIVSGDELQKIVDSYYSLDKHQKPTTWEEFMQGEFVTLSGVIADLETFDDSIVVYTGEDVYLGEDIHSGEDWTEISTQKQEWLPYTFIVELKDASMKNGLTQGDVVSLKARLDSPGDKVEQIHWTLNEGEIIE